MRIAQRASAPLPGSDGEFTVTLGDITGGQVAVTLGDAQGARLLDRRSLDEGGAAPFDVRGHAYLLRVVELDTSLLGTDHAVLEVSEVGGAAARAEDTEAVIEALLALVAASDLTFVRNGDAHPADKAVEHLRRKWDHAGDRITSPELFIDELATRSSLSGKPYAIRWPDGREQPSGEWFHARLEQVRAASEPPAPANDVGG